MATFRKSVSKTRAALESSTALPPVGSDVLEQVGEQAAKTINSVKTSKSGRKAGVASKPPIPADAGLALTAPDTANPHEPRTAMDLIPAPAEVSAAAAAAVARTTDAIAENRADATEAAADLAQSVDRSIAEVGSLAADVADQASYAGAHAAETLTRLATETMADSAARAADMTAAAAGVTAPLADAAATVTEQAGRIGSDGFSEPTLGEFNAKLADLFRNYIEDSMAFFAAITAVRSVPEALSVNQQHFQRRMTAITIQSRELTLLAGKLAAQTWTPFTPAAFR